MKDVEFIANKSKDYKIIRDYYVSNDDLQGIYFVMLDESNNKVFNRFLKNDLINNDAIWKKKSVTNSTRFCMEIQLGEENKVVHEEGTLTVRNQNGGQKQYDAEKITFYMKPNI